MTLRSVAFDLPKFSELAEDNDDDIASTCPI